MRILLIRHGTVTPLGHVLYGRMPAVLLNEKGRGEAQAVAQVIKQQYRLAEVVSSPLERAFETARLIADASGVNVSIDEDLNEINFGSWMGKTFVELREAEDWRHYNEFRSTFSPPGGEYLTEVQARAWRSIERILARYGAEDTVAMVSHGDVLRGLLLLLLGMPIDNIHRLEVSPASLTEVLVGAAHPRVLRINQIFY